MMSLTEEACYLKHMLVEAYASVPVGADVGGTWSDQGMTAFISHTSIDCRDAYSLSQWWKQVLGYVDDPEDPNETGDEECWIQQPDGGHPLLFIEVPESKEVKNRIHLDLCPSVERRDQELVVLLEMGAREVADRRRPDGGGWVVLADPEGNEFCILRGPADRDADLAANQTASAP